MHAAANTTPRVKNAVMFATARPTLKKKGP